MNEVIKDFIRQTSCIRVVSKFQMVLTKTIHQQTDEKTKLTFRSFIGNLMWTLDAKKLHIVA
jgi:hypothetical protein